MCVHSCECIMLNRSTQSRHQVSPLRSPFLSDWLSRAKKRLKGSKGIKINGHVKNLRVWTVEQWIMILYDNMLCRSRYVMNCHDMS